MSLTAGYRDATYDMDPDFNETTSWPDGLHEELRFSPNLPRAVRRTSSCDDIAKFKRYFTLAQSNQGYLFTWKTYLDILRTELLQFDTLSIMDKIMAKELTTPINSEISCYVTASDSEPSTVIVKKKIRPRNKQRKISFNRKETGGDAESISSVDDLNSTRGSSVSLTPQKNLLKKMCTEIRTLARKTCKTVEKISSKSKYCSSCGNYIGNVKAHQQCSGVGLDEKDCTKPLTPSMIKGNNIMKSRAVIHDTPMKTPTGGGELPSNNYGRMTFAPTISHRMRPFISRSPNKMRT